MGASKHYGLGVERDRGESTPLGRRRFGCFMGNGRDRGGSGSGYGRSFSLAVAPYRTRSLIEV